MAISLSPAQLHVINHGRGPILVIAGPGSGKTRVLTERVRRLLSDEEGHFRVLALTFTNKAANEMIERLQDVPEVDARAFIGTLHSFCMEVLANRGRSVGIVGLPNIFESFEDRLKLLAQAVDADRDLRDLLASAGDAKAKNQRLASWLRQIGEHKNNLVVSDMIEDPADRRIYEAYNSELRESEAIDFDDLLLLTYQIFEETPKIAGFYRRLFRYICVDEAQDLNEAQYRLLCALCGDEHRDVMLVGDPRQAIYVWNGADPKYMDLFERDFGALRVELTENFRSSRAVVGAAKALDPKYELQGQLPVPGLLELFGAQDEEEEAQGVCSRLESLIEEDHPDIEGSLSLDRCAVLGRTRYVFGRLEEAIQERGWPYHKKLSMAAHDFSSDMIVEFQLALRTIANPHDRLHLGMLASRWGIGEHASELRARFHSASLGVEQLQQLAGLATNGSSRAICKAANTLSWTRETFNLPAALAVLEEESSSLADEERASAVQDIGEWRKAWDQFVRSQPGGRHSLTSFLSHVALGTTEQPKREGLGLLTVHSAKGMEFDVVFVIGLCEGTFPDYRARGRALEEEARNAFVAVTRSRRLLYLSYPKLRMMPWGDVKRQEPSRFFLKIRNSTSRD